MAYRNLQHFIDILDESGELLRIKEYVDPLLEIAEITDRISKSDNNKALLFENTGYKFPVLMNSMGSYKRICLALGVNELDDIGREIEELFGKFSSPKEGIVDKLKLLPELGKVSSWMPKVTSKRGECQEVVMDTPDMTQLPVIKCWPEDGGPFVTLPVVHTKDPISGLRNVGMYRMQVFSEKLTGMHWHKHKVSAGHFNEYKKLNKKMPVAVILGGDPVYTYTATAPLPPNVDEYMLAGFIRKKKVELVKCLTQDIYVPEDADIVIEGYVDPNEELIWEGPFGDHTGYYSLPDWYPKFHITCITHKKNAIYPATIVGVPPQEDAWIGKATERIFLTPIKMTLAPEVIDMNLPVEGVFHNITIVKIKKEYPGQAQKVMNAMWGAGQMMFNKILIIADEHVNIHDYTEVAKAISENVNPKDDIYFSRGAMDVLDHSSSKFAFGGKMCIDTTNKFEEEKKKLTNEDKNIEVEIAQLSSLYPEIKSIYTGLLKKGISIVFISVEKNRKNHIKELNEQLFKSDLFHLTKIIVYLEQTLEASDIAGAIWHFANNIDPVRDSYIIAGENENTTHIGLDGTRKTKEWDNFQRDWPNVVCSDEATIKIVDEKWSKLNLGKFIASPSLKYRKQLYFGGASVSE